MRARNSHLQLSNYTIAAMAALTAVATIGFVWLINQRTATAAPSTDYTTINLSNPWTVKRGAPSGGYTATATSLSQSVDSTVVDPIADNRTEVLSKTIPDSSAVTAKLKIDSDWKTKPVRVGLWGEPFSAKDPNVGPSWPILEFTTIGTDDFTGFRVYDTRGGVSPKWYNLTDVDFNWDKTYALEIAYNKQDETYNFYVDNNLALTLPASRSDNDDSPRDTFRSIMFATYNSATEDADDNYSATWTEAAYGTPKAAPVTTPLTNATTDKPIALVTPAGTTLTASSTQVMNKKQPDNAYSYPLGLVSFSFTTTENNNTVSLVFVTNLKPNQVVARKYNPATHKYTTIKDASITETTLKGKHALTLSYTIADNGPLDLDPATGAISDPVGLAQVPGAPNTGLAQENIAPTVAASIGGIALVALGVIVFRRGIMR